MILAVFGLGKLGLTSAACFATRGHTVLGYDVNPALTSALQHRTCPIQETGLAELLDKAWPTFRVCDDPGAMVAAADASLIIVPTPSLPDGSFSNAQLEEVLQVIGPALRQKDAFHVVNVVSTVMPGSSEGVFQPLLEELSAKKCGRDFGLTYNPEFIALGSIIQNFLNPDLVLIGASDHRSSSLIQELYQTTCRNRPTFAVMSLMNAELTKLSLNCFVTLKISFANELATLCEHLPGADVDVITRALGADSRIGPKYLKGGLGFGGPCFPRDNLAFQALAREAGAKIRLSPQVVAANDAVVDRLKRLITGHTPPPGPVALLGLAYKPGTHIVEESQAIKLAWELVIDGYHVRVHDPQALCEARGSLADLVTYCDDPYACLHGARAAVLLTDWPRYAELDWSQVQGPPGLQPVLLDCWRTLKRLELPNFRYLARGLGPRLAAPEMKEKGEDESFSQPPEVNHQVPGIGRAVAPLFQDANWPRT